MLPAAGIGSAILTGILRRYALLQGVLDIPNNRSSHSTPTPRGGGLAIVVTFLAGLAALAAAGLIQPAFAAALGGAGFLVALVGFLDDHRPVDARWRLLAHFCAAAWALAWLGGLPPLDLWSGPGNLGWPGHIFAAIYLVWLLNLYNFMDGIDGIAGLEAVTVGLGAAALYCSNARGDPAWALPALLAFTALGFLAWNWPPAKIFMGDAGSGFLGMTFGTMTIQAAWFDARWLVIWLILLAVFIVDATVTLLRRLYRGERIYEAHRSHAYQYAARKAGAHGSVSIAVGAINVFWLLPLAYLVLIGWIGPLSGMTAAYGPLVLLAIRFNAGAREP